jgi:LysM repeat protein
MEFAIPLSRFTPAHVKWGQTKSHPFRITIPFEYEEHNIKYSNLILSLCPLKVAELDFEKNQIVLEEIKKLPYLQKLEQFQQMVDEELITNSKKWIDKSKLPAAIQRPLQPWLKSKRLTLYLSADPSSLAFFTEDGPAKFSSETIKPGDTLRAIVKIHGLSLQTSEDDVWTGKSRIQHTILQLYKVST